MRARLLYRMNTYIETQSSISIMDMIQNNYQCCGVNLWLDWGTVSLGTTQTGTGVTTGTGTGTVVSTGTGTGVSTGTGTGVSTGTGTGVSTGTSTGTVAGKSTTNIEIGNNDRKSLLFLIGTGRRRRHLELPSSPLVKAVRQRRQTTTGGTVYNLPSTYSMNLPLSCCINGGTTSGNAIGGCKYLSIN